MPVVGSGREVAGEPGAGAGVGREVGVDGDFDEVGAGDVGGGLEEDGERRRWRPAACRGGGR